MMPELHPACAAFPPLPASELQELANDIRANGLLEPVTMRDGLLLDGRCRWEACELVGVEVRTVELRDADPISFVLSKNTFRRHLTKSQKGLAVGQLSILQCGSNQYQKKVGVSERNTLSRRQISEQSGVGTPYVEAGRTVHTRAEPHIIDMVRQGEVNIRVAAEAVRKTPRSEQATWTKDDVKREGRKYLHAFDAKRRDKKPGKGKGKIKTPRIDLPYSVVQFPSAEERANAPPGASYDERIAIYEKYGRVQLHPARVKEMLNARAVILQLTESICQCASNLQPEADAYVAALSDLLGYVMGPKDSIDFAKAARTTLARIEKALPIALARLTKLQAELEKRANPAVLFG